ncbi:YdcF family protein [Spirosoma harenae]
MFYFFSKTITYFFTPAGWLLLVLSLAFFTKNAQYRRRLVGSALILFWLIGNSFLTNELALWWEYPIQPVPVRSDSTAQVAVLLTGGMINGQLEIPASTQDQKSNKRFLLSREADRAAQAVYLYKIGSVQKILISGGPGNLPFRPENVRDEGQEIAQYLRISGVRPEDIVLENKARNTHENAQFTARMLQQQFHLQHCVLITSGWHMRRAIACFQKEGITVSPFPTSFLSTKRSFLPGEWLLPREEAMFNAYFLVRELIGYTTYSVMGYI